MIFFLKMTKWLMTENDWILVHPLLIGLYGIWSDELFFLNYFVVAIIFVTLQLISSKWNQKMKSDVLKVKNLNNPLASWLNHNSTNEFFTFKNF